MKGLCWLPWGWGGRESCSAQKNQPGVQSDPEGPVAIFRTMLGAVCLLGQGRDGARPPGSRSRHCGNATAPSC